MKSILTLALVVSTFAATNKALAEDSTNKNRTNQINEKFVQMQLEQNSSIGRAIKSIVGHYPQQAGSIVGTALDLYPDKYKEIIHSAISAQPTLANEVVTIAIEKGITSCSDIVETAISADPSYVDFVVTAAAHSTPDELLEIVRIAVITEPDSADYIVQSLAIAHPNKLVEILQSAIGAVPFVGQYAVEALLAIFPNDAEQLISAAVRESKAQSEDTSKIIQTAKNSGVSLENIQTYAVSGGATTEEVALALDGK
ncbi:hypothetical protein RS130_00785 [Paraglaciecola aquimarina]|uniref:Uncharacterized protein n=1 Tax=Paraglaciecola aquimarina TaxID=1235557 RepID=A0ABU3SRL9_9ALTE|nr:hypothetical protein [Paraglaciecola aquimarina]MDU0352642.1 hypothetical protein [Paraglaciecola aquimarina]